MPSTLLVGPANTVTQNTVYALPARLVHLTSDAALEVSSTSGGGFTSLTNSTTGTFVSSGFVRCTTGNATVRCKA